MDAIGILSAFAPGDVANLQYLSIETSSAQTLKFSIRKSKFIIAFSHDMYSPNGSSSLLGSTLIAPGGRCVTYSYQYNNMATINFDGTIITTTGTSGVFYISIAYCPI